MATTQDRFIWLSKILYPDGRAFRAPAPIGTPEPYTTEDGSEDYSTEDGSSVYVTEDGGLAEGGIHYRLLRATAATQAQAWDDIYQILWDILPDNNNFTQDDANDWYRRLGLYNSGLVSLPDMKLAIAQAQSFPFVPLNKQTAGYIQQQLQAAGFNVYVYKNKFSDGMGGFITKTPDDILGAASEAAYMDEFYLDESYLNEDFYGTKIVQYIEEDKDAAFDVGANWKATFYIAGATIGTFADVPIGRKIEFRQLILKLKRLQMCGFLFVNYV